MDSCLLCLATCLCSLCGSSADKASFLLLRPFHILRGRLGSFGKLPRLSVYYFRLLWHLKLLVEVERRSARVCMFVRHTDHLRLRPSNRSLSFGVRGGSFVLSMTNYPLRGWNRFLILIINAPGAAFSLVHPLSCGSCWSCGLYLHELVSLRFFDQQALVFVGIPLVWIQLRPQSKFTSRWFPRGDSSHSQRIPCHKSKGFHPSQYSWAARLTTGMALAFLA